MCCSFSSVRNTIRFFSSRHCLQVCISFSESSQVQQCSTSKAQEPINTRVVIKEAGILGPTKWRLEHITRGHPAFTEYTSLSRKSDVHQAQSWNSALASSPYPRKQYLLALPVNPPPPSQSCLVSALLLLVCYKSRSCPKSLRKCASLHVRHGTPTINGLFTLE